MRSGGRRQRGRSREGERGKRVGERREGGRRVHTGKRVRRGETVIERTKQEL